MPRRAARDARGRDDQGDVRGGGRRAAAARAAAELEAGEGLDLVELFGGFGAETAKAVFEATGGEVPVGLTGTRERDAAGDQAVIFASPGADPDPAEIATCTTLGGGG